MRTGNNPNRGKRVDEFSKIVLTCVTHLPNQDGYHSKRMEVIQTCLSSMRKDHNNLSMIVWDNGSCHALRDWLQYEFKPTQLILSGNIGKNVARTCLARMLPPDRIIAYSDDDIYFYPGWLEPQIELLQYFPNVAAVSGYPVRTAFRWGTENTMKWARENATLETGRYLPRKWEDDFAISVGREPDWHAGYTEKDFDYRITYKGKQAFATSHHCQFISPVSILGRVLIYEAEAMADEKPTDIVLDKLGLRLCTIDRWARHMGNQIDNDLRQEIEVYPPAKDKALIARLKWLQA